MFACVRMSVSMFRLFPVLRWSKKGSGLIGAHYIQLRAKGPLTYIVPINPGKWSRWREDWVIIWANIHDRLVLPTEALMGKCSD
jgi:hypothetical protein